MKRERVKEAEVPGKESRFSCARWGTDVDEEVVKGH